MKSGKKTATPAAMVERRLFAANVQACMDKHFALSANRPLALARKAGISLSSVQRMLAATHSVTLDNAQAVASVFHLAVYQLHIPHLDPDNPQIVRAPTESERKLYENLRKPRGEHQRVAHR